MLFSLLSLCLFLSLHTILDEMSYSPIGRAELGRGTEIAISPLHSSDWRTRETTTEVAMLLKNSLDHIKDFQAHARRAYVKG
jgi:hypothetical protein